MPDLTSPETWIALVSLTALEVVLGIDNIVLISILCGRLPDAERARARVLGLSGAVVMRLAFLSVIQWVVTTLADPFMTWFGHDFSVKDWVLILGGGFLIAKSTIEIHKAVEGGGEGHGSGTDRATVTGVVLQILVLDLVFSLDSVITAVGMAKDIAVMMAAVIIAIGLMLLYARPVGDFVQRHPTVKMLALSFLVLIGVALFAEGLHLEIPKGYIYSAMAFSLVVEMLNTWVRAGSRKRKEPGPSAGA